MKPKQSLVHRHPWLRTEQLTIFQAANFLFVFTIGLQLGPGFLAALRQQGLVLNALAVTVVALGALTAPALGWLLGIDPVAVLGLLSGATTNTPSLVAAQQTLMTLPGVSPDRHELNLR